MHRLAGTIVSLCGVLVLIESWGLWSVIRQVGQVHGWSVLGYVLIAVAIVGILVSTLLVLFLSWFCGYLQIENVEDPGY